MSDKNQPKQENSNQDNKTTSSSSSAERSENQQDLSASINLTTTKSNKTPENKADTDIKKTKVSTTAKTNDKSKTPVNKSSAASSAKTSATIAAEKPNKLSKTAVLALLLALLAIAASVGHYFWAEQQKIQFTKQLNTEFQKQLQLNQTQISQQLQQQNQQSSAQLKAIEKSIQHDTLNNISEQQQELAKVKRQMASLNQNQPSDWLLHEAEYLIRIASRTLWLEKDTTAAIGLLNDAEQRIQELNDPQYLPLRQTIQQDITSLQLLPKLDTDEVILKLMALEQQVQTLPLTKVEMAKDESDPAKNEISNSTSDWKDNLLKVWQKFINDYITVRRRTGHVEPLMSPSFQQNLRENFSLKLQNAIWSARKAESDIFIASLNDIQSWLISYFDIESEVNKNFNEAIISLKTKNITFEYSNDLKSLSVIRESIRELTQPKKIKADSSNRSTQQINEPIPTEVENNPDSAEGSK